MARIRTGHFEADGNAVNLPLGFVPAYFKLINTAAADTEVMMIEWFQSQGDNVELWHYKHDNDGGDDIATPLWKSSGGYCSAYGSTIAVDTGTDDSLTDPVRVTNRSGVTISGSFMDDGDEILYLAIEDDFETDHGDINA